MKRAFFGLTVIVLFAVLGISCSDNSSAVKTINNKGALRVKVTTIGSDRSIYDQNGYMLTVGKNTDHISVQDEILIDNLSTGRYKVSITDLANNCEISNKTPIKVRISARETTLLNLKIRCSEALKNRIIYFRGKTPPFSHSDIMLTDPVGNNKKVIESDKNLYKNKKPIISPNGTKIVYIDDHGIHIINSENYKNLYTFGNSSYYGAEFSLDGSKIIFNDKDQIDIINSDIEKGKPPEPLFTTVEYNYVIQRDPTFFSNGKKIAFSADRSRGEQYPPQFDIYIINTTGKIPTRLTNNNKSNRHPVFTKNGENIIYQSSDRPKSIHIEMVNIKSKKITTLTNGRDDHSPLVAPDGSMLVFIRTIPVKNDYDKSAIFMKSLKNKSKTVQLTTFSKGSIQLGNFSPNSKYIVYMQSGENRRFNSTEIFKVRTDGNGTPIQLTNNSYYDAEPFWSQAQ